MSKRGIQEIFRRLKRDAGLQHGRGLVHKCRHSFATTLLEHTGDMKACQTLLGHSTLRMTQRYTEYVQAELVADTDGEVKVRIDGQYLAQALKACGGMVEFKLANSYSPMLFIANGYQLVVMPMLTSDADKQAKADREAKAHAQEPQPTEQAEQAEPEPVTA